MNPTLMAFLEAEKHLNPDSRRSRRSYLRQFFTWLANETDEEVDTLDPWACLLWPGPPHDRPGPFTPDMLARYMGTLSGKSARALQHHRTALRAFCRWGVRLGKLAYDYTEGLSVPRYEPQTRWIPDVETFIALVDISIHQSREPLRDYAVWQLLGIMGMRVSEITGLTPADIRFQESLLVLSRTKTTGLQRRPLPRPVAEAIRDYLASPGRPNRSDALFVWGTGRNRGRRLSRKWIETMVSQAARELGLTYPVTPHLFRHFAATTAVRSHINLPSVQRLLGHESLRSTRHYTHLSWEDLVVVRDAIPWC